MRTITVDPDRMRDAAQLLARTGIWTRRDFWTDEHDREVPAGDPQAVNRDYIREVDYDHIVALVVGYLLDAPVAPTTAPDWIGNPGLTRTERLTRFEALNPQPTTGPEEVTV